MGEQNAELVSLAIGAPLARCDVVAVALKNVRERRRAKRTKIARKLSAINLRLTLPSPKLRICFAPECPREWLRAIASDLHLPRFAAPANGRHRLPAVTAL